eukprot:195267-Chlamydomonas_euryale.AAC.5
MPQAFERTERGARSSGEAKPSLACCGFGRGSALADRLPWSRGLNPRARQGARALPIRRPPPWDARSLAAREAGCGRRRVAARRRFPGVGERGAEGRGGAGGPMADARPLREPSLVLVRDRRRHATPCNRPVRPHPHPARGLPHEHATTRAHCVQRYSTHDCPGNRLAGDVMIRG